MESTTSSSNAVTVNSRPCDARSGDEGSPSLTRCGSVGTGAPQGGGVQADQSAAGAPLEENGEGWERAVWRPPSGSTPGCEQDG